MNDILNEIMNKLSIDEKDAFNFLLDSIPEVLTVDKNLYALLVIVAKFIGNSRELINNLKKKGSIQELFESINTYLNNQADSKLLPSNEALLFLLSKELNIPLFDSVQEMRDSIYKKDINDNIYIDNSIKNIMLNYYNIIRDRGTLNYLKNLAELYIKDFKDELPGLYIDVLEEQNNILMRLDTDGDLDNNELKNILTSLVKPTNTENIEYTIIDGNIFVKADEESSKVSSMIINLYKPAGIIYLLLIRYLGDMYITNNTKFFIQGFGDNSIKIINTSAIQKLEEIYIESDDITINTPSILGGVDNVALLFNIDFSLNNSNITNDFTLEARLGTELGSTAYSTFTGYVDDNNTSLHFSLLFDERNISEQHKQLDTSSINTTNKTIRFKDNPKGDNYFIFTFTLLKAGAPVLTAKKTVKKTLGASPNKLITYSTSEYLELNMPIISKEADSPTSKLLKIASNNFNIVNTIISVDWVVDDNSPKYQHYSGLIYDSYTENLGNLTQGTHQIIELINPSALIKLRPVAKVKFISGQSESAISTEEFTTSNIYQFNQEHWQKYAPATIAAGTLSESDLSKELVGTKDSLHIDLFYPESLKFKVTNNTDKFRVYNVEYMFLRSRKFPYTVYKEGSFSSNVDIIIGPYEEQIVDFELPRVYDLGTINITFKFTKEIYPQAPGGNPDAEYIPYNIFEFTTISNIISISDIFESYRTYFRPGNNTQWYTSYKLKTIDSGGIFNIYNTGGEGELGIFAVQTNIWLHKPDVLPPDTPNIIKADSNGYTFLRDHAKSTETGPMPANAGSLNMVNYYTNTILDISVYSGDSRKSFIRNVPGTHTLFIGYVNTYTDLIRDGNIT